MAASDSFKEDGSEAGSEASAAAAAAAAVEETKPAARGGLRAALARLSFWRAARCARPPGCLPAWHYPLACEGGLAHACRCVLRKQAIPSALPGLMPALPTWHPGTLPARPRDVCRPVQPQALGVGHLAAVYLLTYGAAFGAALAAASYAATVPKDQNWKASGRPAVPP